MVNDLKKTNPVKKATSAEDRSPFLLKSSKDAGVALLAGFVVRHRRVSNKSYDKWINK